MIAAAASAAVVEALAARADDHVVKPFDFDVLSARIRHLRRRADQVSALTRYNAELDARIALRAVELGEPRRRCAKCRRTGRGWSLHGQIEWLQSSRA